MEICSADSARQSLNSFLIKIVFITFLIFLKLAYTLAKKVIIIQSTRELCRATFSSIPINGMQTVIEN